MLIIIFLRYQGTARMMFNSFGSSLWMMPFSKYCRTDNKYWKHFSGGRQVGPPTYHCDEQEFKTNLSGWPTKIINIEIPSTRGKIDDSFTLLVGNQVMVLLVPNCLIVMSVFSIWCISFILRNTWGQLVQHGVRTTYSIIFLSSGNIRWHLFQGNWRLWPRQQEALVPVREVSVISLIIKIYFARIFWSFYMKSQKLRLLKLHFFWRGAAKNGHLITMSKGNHQTENMLLP